MTSPRAMTCPGCGGPLAPEPGAVRVTCGHCQTTSEIATEGQVRVAKVLAKAGVHVSPNPMSVDDIEAELRERDAQKRMQQQTTTIFVGVILLVLAGVVLASVAMR